MKDLFLETFMEDLQKIYNSASDLHKNEKRNLKIHDKFWNSLSAEQKDKFRDFEQVLREEDYIMQEEIYVYALKKGIALGFLSCLAVK